MNLSVIAYLFFAYSEPLTKKYCSYCRKSGQILKAGVSLQDKLENEEKEILDDYENGEYVEISDLGKEIEKHTEYARATFLKNKRINIRISQRDLEYIQRKALEEGIPYQTLIASLIHKYISGKLIEKDKVLLNQ